MGGGFTGGRLEAVFKAGVLSLTALLILLSVSSMTLLSKTKDYLEDELEARLLDIKGIEQNRLSSKIEETLRDPYDLSDIALSEQLVKVRLLGHNMEVFSDSRGDGHKEVVGITGQEFRNVWDGLTVVSPIYRSKSGLVRSVYFPVRNPAGRMMAVCEMTLNAGHIEDLTELGTTHFFMKAVVIVVLIVSVMYMIGTLLASQRRMVQAAKGAGLAGPDSGDNVSFVIASFQSVVRELKEKERELGELKDRAEEKARFIESYNENVLRNVHSGVMTFAADGAMKTMNPAARSILGISGPADIGQDELYTGEDGWVRELVDATLKQARPMQRGEGFVTTPSGVSRWIGAGTSPMLGEDGELQGAILVFTDLTEVKQLREKMELKERMTVLGDMSAGIAHELRNPMAVISGYAKLLARRLAEDAELKDAVDSIQVEISGMDELIREFMNFAKPTELNVAEVEILPLLDESIRSVPAGLENVEVSVHADDGLPPVYGDGVLLRQVFVNLVKNAFEAMPTGGTLDINARCVDSAEVANASLPSGTYVMVEVSDTGSGIPRDSLAKIFTPFFSTKGRGTGLGLALVQKILVYHGGRASVKSVEGGGTSFCVYLPTSRTEVR